MGKTYVVSAVLLVLVHIIPSPVSAAGLFLTNGYTQIAPAEDRALLLHDGKVETIYTSTTFTLNPLVVWNFAFLLPIPSQPTVEIVATDVFQVLDAATEKANGSAHASSTFSRPAYLNSYKIFAPSQQLRELTAWLDQKGYILPKDALSHLTTYAQKQWYFVVAEVSGTHIQMAATDSLTARAAHTMPLKITFDSPTVYYPLSLGAVQPDTDSQAVPLAYAYNTTSESVLGVQDPGVDALLRTPSANKYPSLPLDLTNLKIDLFVLAPYPVTVGSFQTIFADWVNEKTLSFTDETGISSVSLPKRPQMLTRLTGYTPFIQLADIQLEKNRWKSPADGTTSWPEYGMYGLIIFFLISLTRLVYGDSRTNTTEM